MNSLQNNLGVMSSYDDGWLVATEHTDSVIFSSAHQQSTRRKSLFDRRLTKPANFGDTLHGHLLTEKPGAQSSWARRTLSRSPPSKSRS